jgi:hypothetical protein
MQQIGQGMENIEQVWQPERTERVFPSWHVVASAWALVLLLVILFAGVEATASRYAVSQRHANLVGATIPRHDPACAGIPSGECGLGSSLEQAAPYGYPLW